MRDDSLRRWEVGGPGGGGASSCWRSRCRCCARARRHRRGATEAAAPTFVGSTTCRECHAAAYDKWKGSDHERAMDVATEQTVLGDFSDVTFTHRGITSRFFKRDGQVLRRNRGARRQARRVRDQVRVRRAAAAAVPRAVPRRPAAVPDRRVGHRSRSGGSTSTPIRTSRPSTGCTGPGTRRTGTACAPSATPRTCEGLRRGEGDVQHDVVGDQRRVRGVPRPRLAARRLGARAPDGAVVARAPGPRGPDLRHHVGTARRTVRAVPLAARGARRLRPHAAACCSTTCCRRCSPKGSTRPTASSSTRSTPTRRSCRARCTRAACGAATATTATAASCSAQGNELCLQCHQREVYDTPDHHFHKKAVDGRPSDGALCVKCHMAERPYMVVDWRADHSFRRPRPDLTAEIGTPNACSQAGCHADKPLAWVLKSYRDWYGRARLPHYGTTFAAARAGKPGIERGTAAHRRTAAAARHRPRDGAAPTCSGYPGDGPRGRAPRGAHVGRTAAAPRGGVGADRTRPARARRGWRRCCPTP